METKQLSMSPLSIATPAVQVAGITPELNEVCRADEFASLRELLAIYSTVLSERVS
jgi:hypothetical protein